MAVAGGTVLACMVGPNTIVCSPHINFHITCCNYNQEKFRLILTVVMISHDHKYAQNDAVPIGSEPKINAVT